MGDRGRRVTRERDGVSGEERCEDRLLATEDGDAFDRDWAAAAAASELHDERRFPSLDAFGAMSFFRRERSMEAVFPERGRSLRVFTRASAKSLTWTGGASRPPRGKPTRFAPEDSRRKPDAWRADDEPRASDEPLR